MKKLEQSNNPKSEKSIKTIISTILWQLISLTNQAPFVGRLETRKAIGTLKSKDPVKKDLKLNLRLFMLTVLITGHSGQAFTAAQYLEKGIKEINSTELVAQNIAKLQVEIIKNSFAIAYLIVNLLVTLAQINLFLRLTNAKFRNKKRMMDILIDFGIGEGGINIEKFVAKVMEELLLEPKKRHGINALIYLLDDKEKELVKKLLNGENSIETNTKTNTNSSINSSLLLQYLELREINFLDKGKKTELIKKLLAEPTKTNFSQREIITMFVVTLLGQSIWLSIR